MGYLARLRHKANVVTVVTLTRQEKAIGGVVEVSLKLKPS